MFETERGVPGSRLLGDRTTQSDHARLQARRVDHGVPASRIERKDQIFLQRFRCQEEGRSGQAGPDTRRLQPVQIHWRRAGRALRLEEARQMLWLLGDVLVGLFDKSEAYFQAELGLLVFRCSVAIRNARSCTGLTATGISAKPSRSEGVLVGSIGYR